MEGNDLEVLQVHTSQGCSNGTGKSRERYGLWVCQLVPHLWPGVEGCSPEFSGVGAIMGQLDLCGEGV